MDIQELYNIINNENDDSEIVAMSIVVKDSNSGELTVYLLGQYDGIEKYKID